MIEQHQKQKEREKPQDQDLVALSVTESTNEMDNMSLAEIIQKKYKSHMKKNKYTTPEEAAKIMIKDTK